MSEAQRLLARGVAHCGPWMAREGTSSWLRSAHLSARTAGRGLRGAVRDLL